MKFRYKAYDAAGQEVRDSIEASDVNEATEALRKKGVVVAEISEEGDGSVVAKKRRIRLGGGGHKTLVMILRQLAVLVSTGTPVVEALGALERQCRDAEWKEILGDVRKRVEEGSSLADAMNEHSRHFDPVCRSLVAAGESGGRLEDMLNRLAALARQQMHIRNTVFGAMVYPILLIAVAVSVLSLMIGFVLPRFAVLFKTLDMPLPATTSFLMGLSGIMRSYWWAIIGGAILVAIAVPIWLKSQQGKRVRDTVLIHLPQLGRIARSLATARILRILGVLLESRVPLLESLTLTKAACGNMHYERLIQKAEDYVTRGESLSHALSEGNLIESSVCEAIRNGEQNGQIAPVMLGMADYLDDENEVIVRSLTSILEPVILIVLGVLVGIVAISMFLPLFDLTAMAGQGG